MIWCVLFVGSHNNYLVDGRYLDLRPGNFDRGVADTI